MFVVLSAACTSALAQRLHIRVVNGEDLAPIANAFVFIREARNSRVTDSSGVAAFTLSPGRWTALVHAAGFHQDSVRFSLNAGDTLETLSLSLRPKVYDFPSITVLGKRPEPELQVFGAARIATEAIDGAMTPGGERDVFQALNALPGVSASSDFSAGMRVRGLGFMHNQVLLDGVELFHPYHMGGFMSSVAPDIVERIDFFRDGVPARFGGKLSSVVDIQTREQQTIGVHGRASLSIIDAAASAGVPITKDWGMLVAARRIYLDPLVKQISEESIVYSFYDVFMKHTIRLDSTNTLNVFGFHGRDAGQMHAVDKFTNDFDGTWYTTAGSITWSSNPDPDKIIRLRAGVSDFSMSEPAYINSSGEPREFDDGLTDYSLQLLANFRNQAHQFQIGMDGLSQRTRYHNVSTPNFYDPPAQSGRHMKTTSIALFLSDQWNLTDALILNTGLRGTALGDDGISFIDPRAALMYQASEGVTLQASYQHTHEFMHLVPETGLPFPTEGRFHPSRDYPPELLRSVAAEVEINNPLPGVNLLSTHAYHREHQDAIEISGYSKYGYQIQLSRGTGQSYGAELTGSGRHNEFGWEASYAYGISTRTFGDIDGGKTFPARDGITHDAYIQGSWDIGNGWAASLTWNYTSGMPMTVPTGKINMFIDDYVFYTDRNAYRLPPHHRLDFQVSYTTKFAGMQVCTYLNVYNLYNRKNMYYYYNYKDWKRQYGFSEYEYQFSRARTLPILPSIGAYVVY